jgi:hypothetical protein
VETVEVVEKLDCGGPLTSPRLARCDGYHSAETVGRATAEPRSARVMRDTNRFDKMPFDKMPFDMESIDTD